MRQNFQVEGGRAGMRSNDKVVVSITDSAGLLLDRFSVSNPSRHDDLPDKHQNHIWLAQAVRELIDMKLRTGDLEVKT
jgi:hypothetical protein